MRTRCWKLANAVVAAGVFVVSGCSAQDSVDDRTGTDAASAFVAPSPSGPRPLTTAQLKSLLLREKDVPQADSAPVQGPVPKYDPRVVVAGPDCQEVFDALVAHDASTSVIQAPSFLTQPGRGLYQKRA